MNTSKESGLIPSTPKEITAQSIQSSIYTIRNQQVMLDADLASIYGYEVRALNQQVKRNISRFPEDFMFQLTREEVEAVKSQIVISSDTSFFAGQSGGRRKPPYAFTEQGIYMLGAVLKGQVADQQTIYIMRAFREMRHFYANNELMFKRISSIELRQIDYERRTDEKLDVIFDYIHDHEESTQKVFFDGQIFDAFSLISDLISKATQDIILIDGYVDTGTLDLLSKKQSGVKVYIYTSNRGDRLTASDITTFNAQYPSIAKNYTSRFHDRFLILDHTTIYHIGASLKDAGKKSFAISLIEDTSILQDLLNRL
ncbi:MAG: ORF6N domain-containing protein [Clostridia bacterium]|nr:ORF6N domain-containing protein [Clostridia bacterium]